jgi:hypothetical protein
LEFGQCVGAITEVACDVVAQDHQVATILGPTAHQDMVAGVVRVPVIDRDRVDATAKALLGRLHQVACPGLEVRERGPILRADDEAEVVAVIGGALLEGAAVVLSVPTS